MDGVWNKFDNTETRMHFWIVADNGFRRIVGSGDSTVF